MSDFVTRLVERQAGTVPTVQPRTSSMFAPPIRRAGSADQPMIDAPSAIDEASAAPVASVHSSDRGDQPRIQADEQDGRRPAHAFRPAAHTAGELRRTESSPMPLGRDSPSVANQPARPVPSASHIKMVNSREQMSGTQADLSGQRIDYHVDATSVRPAARIEPPPRLVDTRRDTRPSSAAAPPSLAAGTVTGRRVERQQAASTDPPVEVTIGRIEVTALSAAPDRKRKPDARRPAMSLEEYLTRRQGGQA